IDTGIRKTHVDFGGRAITGVDEITPGGTAVDCNGHGTHVSGTVGGATYGIAKEVTLVAVRVLDCSGSGTADQGIAGVDWVTGDHLAGQPASANMSLGGGFDEALNNAVENSIADGVTYAIAAGNSSFDACFFSPSSAPDALTVAASASNDARASFSNYGSCVDLYGPGVSITSDWNSSDDATNTISGTSMAAPHVAGAAALYLQGHLSALPAEVGQAIKSAATPNKITGNPAAGTKPKRRPSRRASLRLRRATSPLPRCRPARSTSPGPTTRTTRSGSGSCAARAPGASTSERSPRWGPTRLSTRMSGARRTRSTATRSRRLTRAAVLTRTWPRPRRRSVTRRWRSTRGVAASPAARGAPSPAPRRTTSGSRRPRGPSATGRPPRAHLPNMSTRRPPATPCY